MWKVRFIYIPCLTVFQQVLSVWNIFTMDANDKGLPESQIIQPYSQQAANVQEKSCSPLTVVTHPQYSGIHQLELCFR